MFHKVNFLMILPTRNTEKLVKLGDAVWYMRANKKKKNDCEQRA